MQLLGHYNEFAPNCDVFIRCVNKCIKIGTEECLFGHTVGKLCVLGICHPDHKVGLGHWWALFFLGKLWWYKVSLLAKTVAPSGQLGNCYPSFYSSLRFIFFIFITVPLLLSSSGQRVGGRPWAPASQLQASSEYPLVRMKRPPIWFFIVFEPIFP